MRGVGGGGRGAKRSVAVESYGLPIGVVAGGANAHDIKLLEETLQSILLGRVLKGRSYVLTRGM
jgi:hypothetical protein